MATKTTAYFSPANVRSYMKQNVEVARDPKTDEINATQLAEDAARAFDQDQENGPLDDSDHWLWEIAAQVSETALALESGLFVAKRR